MTPRDAIEMLRYEPEKAFSMCAFIIEPKSGTPGGKCSFEVTMLERSKDDNMFLIKVFADPAGNDYFYPCIHGTDVFGFCEVPKRLPTGTLVFTNGMNGCSGQVDNLGDRLKFIHCKDGHGQRNLNTLCRFDWVDFVGRNKSGLLYLIDKRGLKYEDVIAYAHHPIIIKEGDRWGVYTSSTVYDKSKNVYRLQGTVMAECYKIVSFSED